MADRDGERVRSVVRRRLLGEAEDRSHHPLHLLLVGAPVAADGLLDRRRRVLGAEDVSRRAGHEDGAARLADGERGAGVDADERVLEDDGVRPVEGDQLGHRVVDPLQTEFGSRVGTRLPPIELDGADAPAFCMNDSVPARCRSRIDAEDLHGSRLGAVADVPPAERSGCPDLGRRLYDPSHVLEAIFLASIIVVPLLAGAVSAYLGRPWWWAALAAVVVLFLFAILPPPEEGEPRVAAGDILFLLIVALIAVALVWLGALLGRRLRGRAAPR